MAQYKPVPIDIFPIPVSSLTLPTQENQEIKNFFFSHIQQEEKGIYTNDGCPTLFHYKDIFTPSKEELSWLKTKIEKYANFVYKDIMNHVTQLEVTDAWFNYAKKGSSQYIHNHANSTLSGTLFIDVKDDFLIFHSPYHQPISANNIIHDPPAQTASKYGYNYHEGQKEMNTPDGTILFWPSYLKHSYLPTKHEGRLTISFNCLPTHFNYLYSIKPKT